jgi:hypothetical protein
MIPIGFDMNSASFNIRNNTKPPGPYSEFHGRKYYAGRWFDQDGGDREGGTEKW